MTEPTDETEYLLSSPSNAERLGQSVKQVRSATKRRIIREVVGNMLDLHAQGYLSDVGLTKFLEIINDLY